VQAFPHAPQLLLSLATQMPLQSTWSAEQAHWPPSQCLPPVQLLKHDPQLRSVVRSWQLIPQQSWPGPHCIPHAPQSVMVSGLMQVPRQHTEPLPQ
jgi:hypothetical protein